MPNKIASDVLPTYRAVTTKGQHRCKTKTAMVAYVLEQKRKGDKSPAIFIDGCATDRSRLVRAKARVRALHAKRVSAILHGRWNVFVTPTIPLREAAVLNE